LNLPVASIDIKQLVTLSFYFSKQGKFMNLNELHNVVKRDGIIFLSYGGFLSQSLIAAMTENLEREAVDNDLGMRLSNNIFIIFIELSQNMMKYTDEHKSISPLSESLILVGKDDQDNYFVTSRNIVLNEHVAGLKERLTELQSLDTDSIKKKYREMRRKVREAGGSGAGIGFYEVAKCAKEVEHEIIELDEKTSYFIFRVMVGAKR
jgi:hypothetical protein